MMVVLITSGISRQPASGIYLGKWIFRTKIEKYNLTYDVEVTTNDENRIILPVALCSPELTLRSFKRLLKSYLLLWCNSCICELFKNTKKKQMLVKSVCFVRLVY